MRSLSREARHERRVQVIRLRKAGLSYELIAQQTGLSRTGVFNICARLRARRERHGPRALRFELTPGQPPAVVFEPWEERLATRRSHVVSDALGTGGGTMTTTFEGTVVRFEQQKTGSWFAHAKSDRLWLDRLEVKKDDGEIVTLNLDRYSVVEAL